MKLCDVEELQLLGTHNYENVMAAAAMAAVYGVPVEVIREAVLAFKGVEHRIEFVTEKQDVAYYNDSKGTNPDAAIKVIQAMNRPTVLLGGGYDKDSEYTQWIQAFDGKVDHDRLGQKAVHAAVKRPLSLLLKHVSRHGNDRDGGARRSFSARMRWVAVQPSMTGICTSISTRS